MAELQHINSISKHHHFSIYWIQQPIEIWNLRKIIPFIIAPINEILRCKCSKIYGSLFAENYKMLLKKIKDLIKWRVILCLSIWKTWLWNFENFMNWKTWLCSDLIYGLSTILVNRNIFCRHRQADFKCMWKEKKKLKYPKQFWERS